MKQQANTKYIFYILIFIIFVIVRANFLINENGIINIELKTLGISSSSFPFGILKETVTKDFFLPFYYLLIHFFVVLFKAPVVIKIFNAIIAFFNILLIIDIGKKILNKNFGYLLGLFFAINHFYLFYTNLIAPYCLNFLAGTILIKTILDFLSRPNKKHTKYLIISNCIFLLVNNLAFLYVIPELALLYLFFKKSDKIKKNIIKISYCSFFAFILTFIVLIIQYYNWIHLIIPNTYKGIGLNIESLYLTINEFISPYLSFDCPNNQTKTVLGMIYSYLINPTFKNINSIKLLITLFYSSFLPIALLVLFTIKSIKNYKFKILFLIASSNFLLTAFFMLTETIDVHPIYFTQLFITEMILLGYGIYNIKDKFLKYITIFCLTGIQFINPEVNSFDITISKSYPTINAFDIFLKEYNVSKADLIVMPYLEQYANLYYKKLTFFDFDYSMLQKNNKKSIIRNLCSKNTKSINKNNISYLINDYLNEENFNDYLSRYFAANSEIFSNDRVIFFIDKLNTKPIPENTIAKISNTDEYTTKLRKIKFNNNMILQNKSKLLLDSIASKTLYNFIDLSDMNFNLYKIVQYKKIDNDYFAINNPTYDVEQALNTHESDYVFLIYKIYR